MDSSVQLEKVGIISTQGSPMRKTDCPLCRGSGTLRCEDCGGGGTVHLPARTLGDWQTLPLPRPCIHCEGDWKVDCSHCRGTGTRTSE